jgi:hypothetical protein
MFSSLGILSLLLLVLLNSYSNAYIVVLSGCQYLEGEAVWTSNVGTRTTTGVRYFSRSLNEPPENAIFINSGPNLKSTIIDYETSIASVDFEKVIYSTQANDGCQFLDICYSILLTKTSTC